jgi:hypothetical protein
MKLIKQLKTLGKQTLDIIPEINSGGCCVFAAVVARRLDNLGIEVKVVTVDLEDECSGPFDIDQVRKNVLIVAPKGKVNTKEQWQRQGLSFFHVGVVFKWRGRWYSYDTSKVSRDPTTLGRWSYPVARGSLTIEEAEAFAAKEDGWNPCFDRDDIPTVHELVATNIVRY